MKSRDEIKKAVLEAQPNVCQAVVWKDGRELYAEEWNGWDGSGCAHVMSVTKSVMALLTGIAVDSGKIGSLDDRVLSYFPEYPVKRGEKTIREVTVRQLLTMRAPYKGKGDPWTKVCTSGDWTAASLDFLGGRGGVTGAFSYRTVCLHILSGILWKATGMKTADYADKVLFAPLGIAERRNFYAKSAEEHKRFLMDRAPKENVWFADPQGLCTPGYGLCMSARDMAKLGQLCLNGGQWDGRRIVSAGWLREMTEPRPVECEPFRGLSYGYLWWIVHPERNVYAAIGNSGNVIYADPERQITAAVTGFFRPSARIGTALVEEVLLPALGL